MDKWLPGGLDETLRNEWRKGNPGRGKSLGGEKQQESEGSRGGEAGVAVAQVWGKFWEGLGQGHCVFVVLIILSMIWFLTSPKQFGIKSVTKTDGHFIFT